MKKHSLTRQITSIVSLLVAGAILLCWVLNTTLLPRYYMHNKKEVLIDGEPVRMTPIEYNILLLLMKNPGRVFSATQIYESIWNEDALAADNTVAVHVRHIREKIEINPREPRNLKVVWGLGYKIEKLSR